MDGDEWRSPLQVRSVDEADKEPDLLKAQLDMLRSDILVQEQRQETHQVAMQQLVEQMQQLSKSLSLNTSGSLFTLLQAQCSMLELQRIWPLSS